MAFVRPRVWRPSPAKLIARTQRHCCWTRHPPRAYQPCTRGADAAVVPTGTAHGLDALYAGDGRVPPQGFHPGDASAHERPPRPLRLHLRRGRVVLAPAPEGGDQVTEAGEDGVIVVGGGEGEEVVQHGRPSAAR